MNLKEAFRFQNKLDELVSDAECVLSSQDNVTLTKRTYLYNKVDPKLENETITVIPDTEYYRELNHMIDFLMYLLREKETLCAAVNKTKRSLDFDLDGEVRLNMCRRKMAEVFRSMARIRGSEVTEPNGGIGYRFNNEGNQISYKCDVRRVTVINFDRNTVRKYASKLGLRADDMSLEIDKCMIGCEVDYEPGFDVNDSFEEVFEKYNSKELQVRR